MINVRVSLRRNKAKIMKLRERKIKLNHQQMGFTLIEVLVSIFLMSVGLVALVVMQLKTQGGVREAESLTAVAMAADSLMEGMSFNPTLSAETKSWSAYTGTNGNAAALTGESVCAGDPAASIGGMTSQEMADMQICMFKNNVIAFLPKDAGIFVAICKADAQATTKLTPSVEGLNCSSTGKDTMIKVVWRMKVDKNNLGDDKLVGADGKLTYSYQIAVNAQE